ncbi:hypothetical protein LJB42_001894 [Komagataella kurtzmanii]|nr:hypothetical protein LJB42_001894 [Komagataella kurtzmanii]
MGANTSTLPKRTFKPVVNEPEQLSNQELIERLQCLLSKNTTTTSEVFNEKGEYDLVEKTPVVSQEAQNNPINAENLDVWETKLLSDPKNQLALNCFTGNNITDIIENNQAVSKANRNLFNYEVKFSGGPITNQKSSGRCWIFASTNVFKSQIKSKFSLDSFELSQNYLFFYDKLEKSNYFLHNIIESADEDLDSRLNQFLLDVPINDGGQWDMIVNLVEKYGLVPHDIYPDSFSATSSSRLNYIITNKLREFALILRKLVNTEGMNSLNAKENILSVKETMIKEIYSILALTLGVPPKADDEIVWDYKDKFGNYLSITTTPKKFYKKILGVDATQYFSVINDPRNDYNKLYTVDKLNNVLGGKPIDYVNAELPTIKEILIKMIKKNEPVFFGSDVGKFEDTKLGLMDVNSWDYELGFGTNLNIDKKARLLTGSSQMTHAMVITGVHLIDGKPVRWKVENSWGTDVGHDGYFIMTDEWFDQYVFQIVTSSKYAPAELVSTWKSGDYQILPFYDPMGALA